MKSRPRSTPEKFSPTSRLPQDAARPTSSAPNSEAPRNHATDESTPIRISPQIPGQNWAAISKVVQSDQPSEWADNWSALAKEFKDSSPESSAVALLLRDYLAQGWGVSHSESALWLIPPRAAQADGESPATVKRRLRSWLEAARADQLSDPNVQQFLRRMEMSRRYQNRQVSVLRLVDDGADLAAQLSALARLPDQEVAAAMRRVVRPAIELVSADSLDTETGLRLIDVWRYFRHTWSIKYRPTPGRTLQFLIRNEARPNRPVIGIGSLANATLQITTRDDYIGWSLKALTKRIKDDSTSWAEIRDAMLSALASERRLLRQDDLRRQVGSAKGIDLEHRLLILSDEADKRRQQENEARFDSVGKAINGKKSLRRLPVTKSGAIDWKKASSAPLFVAKRARLLSQILFAERILKKTRFCPSVDKLQSKSDVLRAMSIAAREIRKVGLASRVLELNVCGAIPPYNELLAGKLTALAASCQEIRDTYAKRYSTQPSEIASQMSGREVFRSVDICLVTTTSLYGVSSSQYNRLKVNVETQGGPHKLEWRELGSTLGQGTAQFSDETTAMLREAAIRVAGSRRVNNVFGEGQSPLLRQVREALGAIGMPEQLLFHGAPRRMYALELFDGGRKALILNQKTTGGVPTFEAIAAAWSDRWLSRRIKYAPAVAKMATIRGEIVARAMRSEVKKSRHVDVEAVPMLEQSNEASTSSSGKGPSLVRSLYRSLASCADHHDATTVAMLHIETAVDSFIRIQARRGGVIFVTGNPGDGKTHLLRHLDEELTEAGMEVILDANQLSDDVLAKTIERAYSSKKGGAILAINEGVLVNLLDCYPDRPWAKNVKEYLFAPFWYREEPTPIDRRVCVVDLNLRNNLAPAVIRKAIKLLLRMSAPCQACPKTTCSLYLNSTRLRPESSEQLVRLMETIGNAGTHATMRDVHGFLGYVLAGSASCEEEQASRLEPERYWRNAFEGGQGHLFDLARKLDPIKNTDPVVDDALWRSADDPGSWLEGPISDPRASSDFESRVEAFQDRKRQALFEYRGAEHLAQVVNDGTDRLLREIFEAGGTVRKLVALLNKFFDRDETSSEVLYLWVTHRFDAQPARFAAAMDTISVRSLEILGPQIRPELAEAFPDYQPSHVILTHREAPASEGLRVDRPLVSALLDSANGLPTAFRRGEPEARIAAFYERLRYRLGDPEDTTVYVRLVDRDTGSNHRVAVDLVDNSYAEQ